jgi:hypothetical protein
VDIDIRVLNDSVSMMVMNALQLEVITFNLRAGSRSIAAKMVPHLPSFV